MNREIKLRAWLTNENGESKMLHDYATNSRQNGEIIKPSFHSKSDFYIVKECVLMQFTGLYDRHNNPIYEGDIVKVNILSTNDIGVIKWVGHPFAYFGIKIESGVTGLTNNSKELGEEFAPIVIGNIYENPELLKKIIHEVDI